MLRSKSLVAAQAAVCLLLTGCNGCDRDVYFDINGSGDLKRAPIFYDLNNILLQVAQYKLPVGPNGFDKGDRRLAAIGKKNDSGGFGRFERTLYGEYELKVRIAYFETDGLISNVSFAGVEIDSPPDGQMLEFDFFGMSYRSDVNGILVFAQSETGPKGTPKLLANTNQVIMRITQTATTFEMGATPIGNFVDGAAEQIVYSTPNAVNSTTPFKVGMGVQNLDKGGRYYFDFVSLRGPDVEGPEEGNINASLGSAAGHAISAAGMLGGGMRDFVGAAAQMDMATADIDAARRQLDAALVGNLLEPTSLGDNAMKVILKAQKDSDQIAQTIGNENEGQINSILKKIEKLNETLIVAGSNLCGYDAKNRKQVPLKFPIF